MIGWMVGWMDGYCRPVATWRHPLTPWIFRALRGVPYIFISIELLGFLGELGADSGDAH